MSSSNCIVTVCSADSYQNFVPLFIYSALRAIPDVDVLVLLTGKKNDVVTRALEKLPVESGERWRVVEDQFLHIPAASYSVNCLRYLIPHEFLKPYRFAYITDIDFVMLPHKIDLFRYFRSIMHVNDDMPIASFGSAVIGFKRPKIHGPKGWTGRFKRIVGGTTMIDVSRWYNSTKAMRNLYTKIAIKRKADGIDKFRFGSYREYDEVMLARMCSRSGIKLPEKRNHFCGNIPYDYTYRDVHLGDLKFGQKKAVKRFRRNVSRNNRKRFLRLWKDPVWCEIVAICSESDRIKKLLDLAKTLCKRKKRR